MPVWSSNEVESYRARINAGIDSLTADIDSCWSADNNAINKADWYRFRGEWITWAEQHSGFLDEHFVALLGTVDTMDEYARRLEAWREIFRRSCGREPSGPEIEVPSDVELQRVQETVERAAKAASSGLGYAAALIGGGAILAIIVASRAR